MNNDELSEILAKHKLWVESVGVSGARANLTGANITGANITGAIGLPDAPTVPDLDRKILEASEDGARLEMGSWHCGTTHCRAGWAIALAGAEGAELEKTLGASAAGALIYFRSTGRVPDFFASNADALNDIRKCAGGAA